ncbi:MAG: hypothetical protein ACRD3D_13250 [Terriglobia bacterium]
MPRKNATLEALEPVVLDEIVREGFDAWRKQLDRLRRAEPGSPAYRDALCELWTLCDIIEIKAQVASQMIDEYLDVLPDDD